MTHPFRPVSSESLLAAPGGGVKLPADPVRALAREGERREQ